MKYIVSANVNDTEYKTIVSVRGDCKLDRLLPKCALALQFHVAKCGCYALAGAHYNDNVFTKNGNKKPCAWFENPFISINITEYNGKRITV